MDMSTLKQRLQQIAVEVSRRARNQNESSSSRDGSSRGDRETQFSSSQNGMRGGSSSPFMNRDASTGGSGGARMTSVGSVNPMSMPAGGDSSSGYSQSRNDRVSQQPQPQQQQRSSSSQSQNRNDPEWKMRIRHKQQRLLLLHHSAKCTAKGPCPVTPHCADMKRLWRHMEGCKDNNCRVPHCFSSRAILSHYRKCRDSSCPACGPVRETVRKSQSSRGSNSSAGQLMNSSFRGSSSMQQQQKSRSSPTDQGLNSMGGASFASTSSTMPPPGGSSSGNDMQYSSSQSQYRPSSANAGSTGSVQPLYRSDQHGPDNRAGATSQQSKEAMSSTALPSASRPPGSSESEWQKIRHKQQRLLLLRHASRCQHEPGTCPVTPHCASMKKLWEHIAHCKNQQCKVQHCLSSRYVLSHYRRCRNPRCPSCGPVRDSIRRSTEREKNRQPQTNQSPVPSFDSDRFAHDDSIAPTNSMSPQPSEPSFEPKAKRPKIEDAHSVGSTMTAPMSNQSTLKETTKPRLAKTDSKKAQTGDHSLLNSFTLKNLETHLRSLDRKEQLPPAKFKSKCIDVLKGLQTHQHGWVFNCPVDPVELGLPDYFDIVKKPMDLGTIQKKLDSGAYHIFKDFETDVNLTFDNAMTYNDNGSVVHGMAKELKEKFDADMAKLMAQLEEEDLQRRQNERACTLCGCEKLSFEPPVYFCNGMNCQSQRIRRNSHFYIGGNNQYFWCSGCYNELDDKIPIELVDMTIMKRDLKKKKNDELHEESWVQCDTCERWVHQICGMFNTRQNKEHHSEYCCPRCLLDKRKKGEIPSSKPPGAADLPRTMFSEWLEQHIAKRVERKKRELADEKARAEVRMAMAFVPSCVCRQYTNFFLSS